MNTNELRTEILNLVREFAVRQWPAKPFVAGESPVPVSGKVFDADDVVTLVDSSLDFWLTAGRFSDPGFRNENSLRPWARKALSHY